jgi:hypothetical protein
MVSSFVAAFVENHFLSAILTRVILWRASRTSVRLP